MTFYDVVQKFKDFDYQDFFEKVTDRQIEKIIDKEKLDKWDFLALLSPTAEKHMEEMAQKSHRLSLKYFGKMWSCTLRCTLPTTVQTNVLIVDIIVQIK